MARNAEKAMTTLARWRNAQDGGIPQKSRRPFLASECMELRQAEKWRNQIISEVSRKVAQIQNAGLGEFRIRDLNDEINKLLREKGHWEVRIKELGGQDYGKTAPKITDMDGQEAPGNRGYIYFGAAKDLPGVRELFEQEPAAPPHRSRGELMKEVDADYYGYKDEEDGLLIPLEVKAERRAVKEAVNVYKKRKQKSMEDTGTTEIENVPQVDSEEDEEEADQMTEELLDERSEVLRFMAHVPNIPTQGDIERALVEKKKRELLQQFLGDDDDDENMSVDEGIGCLPKSHEKSEVSKPENSENNEEAERIENTQNKDRSNENSEVTSSRPENSENNEEAERIGNTQNKDRSRPNKNSEVTGSRTENSENNEDDERIENIVKSKEKSEVSGHENYKNNEEDDIIESSKNRDRSNENSEVSRRENSENIEEGERPENTQNKDEIERLKEIQGRITEIAEMGKFKDIQGMMTEIEEMETLNVSQGSLTEIEEMERLKEIQRRITEIEEMTRLSEIEGMMTEIEDMVRLKEIQGRITEIERRLNQPRIDRDAAERLVRRGLGASTRNMENTNNSGVKEQDLKEKEQDKMEKERKDLSSGEKECVEERRKPDTVENA